MRLSELGEFGFIDRLRRRAVAAKDVVEGMGDDCAVLRVGQELVLVSCDLSIEDVHFTRANTRPEDIGWKALAVSLSDIAAMGGAPKFATVSLAAPPDSDVAFLDGIAAGLFEAAAFGGAVIVGGDTTRSMEGLVIDTTAIGYAIDGRYRTRRAARAGDVLMVSGSPGDAAAGFHAQEKGHDAGALLKALHRPVPRIAEGQWLARQGGVHAMIDVSDGLAQDAGQIASASGLGVDIRRGALPIGDGLDSYCAEHGEDARGFALSGGDAYELAVAVDAAEAESLGRRFGEEFGIPLGIVGEFCEAFEGLRVDGEAFTRGGFDHFAK